MTHDLALTAPAQNNGHHRRRLIPFFKAMLKKERSSESTSTQSSTDHTAPSLPKCCPLSSGVGVQEPLDDAHLAKSFASLHSTILDHVTKYYNPASEENNVPQPAIQSATANMPVSSTVILSLLRNERTRLAALGLCISWTILSRSLLSRLGSNGPGSTFLPPEIVECFQSFSVMLTEECKPARLGVLSRWKQITATLMYSYYVHDSFGIFDARTTNIDDAMKDLDPLLRVYANSHVNPPLVDSRVVDLREVLQTGARFAFTLFAQPSYWLFYWGVDDTVDSRNGVETGNTLGDGTVTSDGELTESDGAGRVEDVVVWPALVRAIDGDGRQVKEVLTKRKFLSEIV